MFTQNNGIIEHSFQKQILSIQFHHINRRNSWNRHSSPKGFPQSSDYSTIESDDTSKISSQEQYQYGGTTCLQYQLRKCQLFQEGYCLKGQNCENLHGPMSRHDKSRRQKKRWKFIVTNYPQMFLGQKMRHKSFLQ